MKRILLLLAVIVWYTGDTIAQNAEKNMPVESQLVSVNSGKISQNDMDKLQLAKRTNASPPVRLMRLVKTRGQYMY